MQREQLKDEIRKLKKSVTAGEMAQAQLATQIQSYEMQIQEREGGNQRLETQYSRLLEDKQALSLKLDQVEADLKSAQREKVIANELCESLEGELKHLKRDLEGSQKEKTKMENELKEATSHSVKLDALVLKQQRQKSELDQSLVVTAQQNTDLMKDVVEMKEVLGAKEQEHQVEVDAMKQEIAQLKVEKRLSDVQWIGREQTYKKTIQQLESKVSHLETKISDGKKKKVEFLEKAREHEQMIQGLKSAFGDSLSYMGKGGVESSAHEVTPRLSKSLPLATPTRSSQDKYSSRSFNAPIIGSRAYGSQSPHSSGTHKQNGYY
jgi:chromosome segregation ATPase